MLKVEVLLTETDLATCTAKCIVCQKAETSVKSQL